jgi:hypothetical protein
MSIKDPSKRGKRSPMPEEAKEKQNKAINHSISHSRNTAKAADVRLVVQIFFNS